MASESATPWMRDTIEAAEELADQVWATLRLDPRAITLNQLHCASVAADDGAANIDTDGPGEVATASLLAMPDGAAPKVPGTKTSTATDDINHFLDSYALHARLDAVDEAGCPFVPFVRPIAPREMQRFEYGVLLDGKERTVLLQHEFNEPAQHAGVPPPAPSADEEGAAADGTAPAFEGVHGNKYEDVFLLQLRAIPVLAAKKRRVINPMVEPEDQEEDDEAAEEAPASAEPIGYRVGFVPCFRLRFRDIVQCTNPALNGSFALAAVLVSGHRFFELHDDLRRHVASAPGSDYYSRINSDNSPTLRQRQEAWAAWTLLTTGSVISDPREAPTANQVLVPNSADAAGAVQPLGTARAGTRPPPPPVCGFQVPGQGELEEVDEAIVADAPPSSSVTSGEDFIPRSCEYATDRMASRSVIVERVAGKFRQQWANLCAELGFSDESPEVARILLKDTRNGINALEGGELTAFVPAAPTAHSVYASDAEEQLRLWISAALAKAEQNGVRQVMLRLDLPMIISRCCGLLSLKSLATLRGEAEETPAPANVIAREHAIRVAVETMEGFVQGSGVIWRGVIMTEAPDAADGLPLGWSEHDVATAELERIKSAKITIEIGGPRVPSPKRGCSRARKPPVKAEDDIPTLSPARRGRSAGRRAVDAAVSSPGGPTAALARMHADETGLEPPMPVPRGYTASPMPTESDLMRIFKRLDRSGDGKLNRQELRRLLIPASADEKSLGADVNVTARGTIAPKRAQDAFLGCGTCLSPIDECGVPITEASVDQYLDKYSRITPGKVSFQEFSCMMLDIARR